MDVDQCFAALDGGLEAFRKASSTEKDLSCLLPEAPRNVCLALQRRVLPALRSAIRSRQTRWQIAESDLSRKLDISVVSACMLFYGRVGVGLTFDPIFFFRGCITLYLFFRFCWLSMVLVSRF